MAEQDFSRRHFFFGSLLAGALPAAGFGSVASLTHLGYTSPNQKLNIATIGAGGQAGAGISAFSRLGENIVALCDPDAMRAAANFTRFDKASKYTDFRKMLDAEQKNIDAVLVATPDFMHGTQAMWAMERGKHVYVQKPMTRTVWEARQLRAAALKYKVATQMGNQGYCQEGTRVAAEMVWSGAVGNVTECHCWTNRPVWAQGFATVPDEQPTPDFMDWDSWIGISEMRRYSPAYAPFSWRGFYDFGCGSLGDMACHVLGAPNMALLSGSAPISVECIKQEGKNSLTFPTKSVLRFEFPARGAMPPLKLYWYDGAKGIPPEARPADIPPEEKLGNPARGQITADTLGRNAPAAGTAPGRGAFGGPPAAGAPAAPGAPGAPVAARAGAAPAGAARGPDPYTAALNARTKDWNTPADSGVLWVGDKGYMTTGEYGGGPRLVPSEKMKDYQAPPQVLVRHPETYSDWVRACKGGDPGASNFEVAAPFTEWIVMGCIALRVEGKLEWDAAKMTFTNSKAANEFLKPSFRKGWSFT
jgi:predicted dehydrogenase